MFNSPGGGVPLGDLREIFSGCQRMARVPNAVEILPKSWTAWVGCTSVTDDRRQTDRQTTDGRATAYSDTFTFAKNVHLILWNEQHSHMPASPLSSVSSRLGFLPRRDIFQSVWWLEKTKATDFCRTVLKIDCHPWHLVTNWWTNGIRTLIGNTWNRF